MFEQVILRAADPGATERFYATVLPALGIAARPSGLRIVPADGRPTTGLHIGFAAPSPQEVDAFWAAGVQAGYRSDGEPGPRPQYREDYYGAFLLDPDGNSAEAVVHGLSRPGGIDHLWIRVADVEQAAALVTGLDTGLDTPERVLLRGNGGSVSFLPGTPPTRNVHVTYRAAGEAELRTFDV